MFPAPILYIKTINTLNCDCIHVFCCMFVLLTDDDATEDTTFSKPKDNSKDMVIRNYK